MDKFAQDAIDFAAAITAGEIMSVSSMMTSVPSLISWRLCRLQGSARCF